MEVLDGSSFVQAVGHLTDRDPHLAAAVARHGPPGFWTRPPGFATLILFVLEQQVSLASARATFDRLAARVGEVTPDSILRSSDAELRADGFSRQKSRYARQLAGASTLGSLDLDGLAGLPDESARRHLVSQTGVGPWTADVYLLSCLRRPDIWPTGDRALQVGTCELLGLPEPPDAASLGTIGERWRPYRSVAARIVWHAYLAERGRA